MDRLLRLSRGVRRGYEAPEPLRTRDSAGTIYLIEESGRGYVKIGFTQRNILERMRDLACATPHTLKLVGTIEGDPFDERDLHDRFATSRKVREWFTPTPEIYATFGVTP